MIFWPFTDNSCKWNHSVCSFLCLALFVYCVVSDIHSYHTRIGNSFVFCWEVFHCIAIPHFVCPLSNWWTFGWFLVHGNEHFCKCLCMDIFSFLFGRYHEWNCCIWLFKELPDCFHSGCIILHSFTLVPVLCESCSFSTSILNTWYC